MNPAPPPDPDRRKAFRALVILYCAMFILAAIPFVALWWTGRGK